MTYARDNKNGADYYIGQFKDDKKHGKGKFVWRDGQIYEGGYQDGFRIVNGTYWFSNGEKIACFAQYTKHIIS